MEIMSCALAALTGVAVVAARTRLSVLVAGLGMGVPGAIQGTGVSFASTTAAVTSDPRQRIAPYAHRADVDLLAGRPLS